MPYSKRGEWEDRTTPAASLLHELTKGKYDLASFLQHTIDREILCDGPYKARFRPLDDLAWTDLLRVDPAERDFKGSIGHWVLDAFVSDLLIQRLRGTRELADMSAHDVGLLSVTWIVHANMTGQGAHESTDVQPYSFPHALPHGGVSRPGGVAIRRIRGPVSGRCG
jgi:hypothetical protein